ncbi:MAG TPA: hypothetical protein VL651_11170 [Bacteroidia bacterium]|jgi:hypothetical protein|nr:hypothetical protein [Bacteroidia bacterium]
MKRYGPLAIPFTIYALVFLYVFIRATILSFTHDEALSYELINGNTQIADTANHHLLNTWLMSFFSKLFGNRELILRLPNLLAFIPYAWFAHKLLTLPGKTYLIYPGIALLFLNPFVLDYFSQARGYGLSLGFLMPSLYFLLRSCGKENTSRALLMDLAWSIFFASLALLANLSMLNFFIAALVIFIARYMFLLFSGPRGEKKQLLIFSFLVLLTLLPLLYAYIRLRFLGSTNQLYFGADNFSDAVSSLFERSFYSAPYPVKLSVALQYFVLLIVPVGALLVIAKRSFGGRLGIVTALLLMITIGSFAENHLFSALYPMGRTGIYFIPLFGLFLFYLLIEWNDVLSVNSRKFFAPVMIGVITLPLCFHFLNTMNLRSIYECSPDAATRTAAMKILEDANGRTSLVRVNWIFEPSMNYYFHSRKAPFITTAESTRNAVADYAYEFTDQFDTTGWKKMISFDEVGSALYKRSSGR